MFWLSKTIGFILLPSNVIGLLSLAGVFAVLIGRRRFGLSLLIFSISLLVICGWSPLGPAMLVILEDRFPEPRLREPVAGIIMLGGAVDTHITAERGRATLNEAGERVSAMLALSRRFP